MTNEITLKIDESNELKFKIKIQGTTSESGSTKQSVRLLITEKNETHSMGLVFPVITTDEDNLLVFVVPELSGIVKPDVPYEGKIEVIIGSRIFCPMTLDIFFIRDMTVEVVPVEAKAEKPLSRPEQKPEKEREDISNLLEEIDKPVQKKQVILTKSQLEAMIRERKEKSTLAAKSNVHSKKPLAVNNFKDSFKELMKSALVEDKSLKKTN